MRAGHIYTAVDDGQPGLSGNGGPAVHASIFPGPITADGFGNILISDINQVQVVAARDGTFYGQPMRHGNIDAAAGVSRPISRLIQDGWLASRVQLGQQSGITVDGDGNVVAANWNSDQVNVIAGQTSTAYGRPMIRAHYYLVAGVSDAS